MSRTVLSLYELDRPALKELTAELRRCLDDNDRDGLITLLDLKGALAESLPERLVDAFLVPEDAAKPLYASLRRITKKRSLSPVFTSSDKSLEGRMRGFELLRSDRQLAKLLDKLMSPKRLPWFLRAEGSTCGWLDGDQRETLARGLRDLRPALTPELVELLDGLDTARADVVLHDAL